MTTTKTDVLVIGAGPTGLMMANLLAHNGVKVRILDKKAAPTEESRALIVHAKTLELLDKLDLADTIIQNGEPLRAAQFLSEGRRSGKLSFQDGTTSKRTPYPFGLIYGQDQTEHLLLQSLAEVGVQTEWNTELLTVEQTPDSTCAHIRTADGSKDTIEALWIIGADSSHSPVRHALSVGFAGGTYSQTLFVADLDMEWDLGSQQGGMDLERHGFFLFFPMHTPGRFRLFGTLPPAMVDRETITLDDVRRLLDTQSHLHITILQARWISVYRTHLRIAERFRVGRVFLAGDAAHIHSPAGGQGMNTGIGDAYNLAWKLALVVKGHTHETLLDSYEAERIPFARSILKGSDLGFQLIATTNPSAQWLKVHVIPQLFRLISPLPLFRRRMFWLVSQLWTSYRNSPAVTDAHKGWRGPRAGDRAPYAFFETGPDMGKSIFTKLKGLDHHLLLFLGKRPDPSHTVEKDVQALLNSYHAPIHLHTITTENRSLHALYGADVPTLFLVRPDGHIAYRGNAENMTALRAYLNGIFTTQNTNQDSALSNVTASLPTNGG